MPGLGSGGQRAGRGKRGPACPHTRREVATVRTSWVILAGIAGLIVTLLVLGTVVVFRG